MRSLKALIIKVLVFLTGLTSYGAGQKLSLGKCPLIASSPVTLQDFVGAPWRVISRTRTPGQHYLRCADFTFTAIVPNVRYSFVMTAKNKLTGSSLRTTGTLEVSSGVAATTTLAQRGYLGFIFDDKRISRPMRYSVIYASSPVFLFTLLYACQEVAFLKLESALLISRNLLTSTQIASVANRLPGIGSTAKLLENTYGPSCL